MTIFPAQYSTLSASALNQRLQQRYALTDTTCRLLIRNVSDTYLLENTAGKYIFKIYRDAHRKLDEIKAEVEWLNILKNNGAQVAYPLKDSDGGQLQSFNAAEGTRYGVLFSYAQGKVVTDLSEQNLQTVGREMALIHDIASTTTLSYPRKEYTVETMLTSPLKTITPFFKHLPDEYNYLLQTGHKVAEAINSFDTTKFSYGYCHYDFLPKNFHFANDGGITFFDFDFCGKGLLANDLASFYVHFFLETFKGKMTRHEADRLFGIFVESYRNVRPITDEEIKAIPYLGFAFWIFYMGFQVENFDDWSNIFFDDYYIKARVALIKKWEEWYL
jgi:Ser/Thr protein kinase RdoA (MazF antagonist)